MDLGLIPSVSKVSARLPQAFLGNPLRLQMEGLGPGARPRSRQGSSPPVRTLGAGRGRSGPRSRPALLERARVASARTPARPREDTAIPSQSRAHVEMLVRFVLRNLPLSVTVSPASPPGLHADTGGRRPHPLVSSPFPKSSLFKKGFSRWFCCPPMPVSQLQAGQLRARRAEVCSRGFQEQPGPASPRRALRDSTFPGSPPRDAPVLAGGPVSDKHSVFLKASLILKPSF